MSLEDLSDEKLREAFAERSGRAAPEESCPDGETIWQAVHRELPAARIRALGLHATTCPACAEAWRLARDVARDVTPAPVVELRRPAPAVSLLRNWWVGGALAAAAAILLVVVFVPVDPTLGPPTGGPLRGEEETIVSRVAVDAPVARAECVLRWEGPPNATYDVRVATEELRVIAEAFGLEATEFRVPEERLADLPPGTRIVWQVHANLPDGGRAASRTFVQTLE